ncbi:MAG: DNA translocase FtsK 4TM domain-containing protein [Mucinivorans sp.]
MGTERDQYIEKLKAKAEAQRIAEERIAAARGARRSVRRPDAPQREPLSRAEPTMDGGRGQNGRQVVEPRTVARGVAPKKRVGKSTAINDQQTASEHKNPAASKSRTAPAAAESSQSEAHIWLSLSLIFVALFLAMSVVSYFIYFQADQYLAYFTYLFDFKAVGAENWGGKLGAIIGNLCVGRSFGVMGVGMPVLAMIWAIKVLKIRSIRLHKATRMTLILMLLGSILLGHFSGYDPAIFGSGYGGELGVYVAEWLQSVIGFEGTSLLLVVGGLGVLYFVNSGWIRSLVHWISRKVEHNRLLSAEREAAERLRDSNLREKIAADAIAARLAEVAARERNSALAQKIAQQTPPIIAPAESKIEPKVEPKIEPKVEPKQDYNKAEESPVDFAEPKLESKPDPEPELTIDDNESSPMAKDLIDRERLIQLQGDQWGYVFDWQVSGEPVYCYLDRLALLQAQSVADGARAAAASMVAAKAKEKALMDEAEDHDVEFIIKSYTEEEAEAAPTTDDVIKEAEKEPEIEKKVEAQADVVTPLAQDSTRKVHFAPSKDDANFIVEQSGGDSLLDDRTINLTELYDPTRELASYKKPPVELLKDHSRRVSVSDEELVENKNRIVHTLETFGIKIDTIEATIGPTVTLYEIIPAPGVRISKIKNLEDDIALSLSALGIRIIAPIPGRGTIGIEVPNKEKETVSMYSVIKSAKFQDSKAELPIALGKTIQNETFVFDLAKMPHLLVAGATGQGKSVGLNAIIASLLYKKHPSQLKFILVDPKKVELTLYSKLEKHFLAKMPGEDEAIITDTQKVIYTLNSICVEMDARYDLLKAAKVRNISEYNDKFIHRHLNPEKGHRFLPYFVVIIDEFADLIMTAGREVEQPIARIAQLARAVGIHMVIATQRPTTNIITGVIKANFPARIAFRVTSMIDSRTILDSPGANQLVGRGDMLVSTGTEVTRVQCAFIDTPEVDEITEFISSQRGYVSAYELPEYVPESEQNGASREVDPAKRDPLFDDVAHFVVSNQNGSASTIQRRYSIGFNRAGRLVDQLEAAGIVGRADGSKARQVLVQDPISLEMLLDN